MDEIKTATVVAPGESKPGWKTSEFWLGLVGILATVGAAATPLVPGILPWIAGASATIASVYIVARTVAKQTKTVKDDEFLDALAGKLAPLIKLDAPK